MRAPASVEVRRARPEEMEAAGEVVVRAYDSYVTGAEDPYLEKLRDAGRRDREAEVWVAVLEGRVVGSVTLCPAGSTWREIAADDEAEFRMLAVDPAAQGHGVGGALLELVLTRARADGMRAVVLSSLGVMTSAHRLYERAGFRRAPARDWTPAPGVDLIAYEKEL